MQQYQTGNNPDVKTFQAIYFHLNISTLPIKPVGTKTPIYISKYRIPQCFLKRGFNKTMTLRFLLGGVSYLKL